MAEPATALPRRRFVEALRPLASRPHRLMWLGSTTSTVGDAVVAIALVFAILHIGGTASDIGLIAAVSTVARIAFVLAGGVWADRLRRQYVMRSADAVLGAVQAPLSSSAGFTTTLVGAAIVGGVPAALTALLPGNRAVRRPPDGEIVGPAGEIIRQPVAAAADPAGPAAAV